MDNFLKTSLMELKLRSTYDFFFQAQKLSNNTNPVIHACYHQKHLYS